MILEKLDKTKPFYYTWNSKFWKGRRKYRFTKLIDEDTFEIENLGQEMLRPERDKWDPDNHDWVPNRTTVVSKQWFESREKNIHQPKELLNEITE